MDVLADLLDGVRARGAVFSRTIMSPPWSLRFTSGAPLTMGTMLRGRAWVVPVEGEPVPIRAGDIAVVRGRVPYTIADDPATPPQAVIGSSDYCSWSEDTGGPAALLSGAFDGRGGVSGRLLEALPDVLVVKDTEGHRPMLDLVAAEIAKGVPGQRVMLDRLLDLLLVSVLRTWFDQSGAHAPAWYRAFQDPVVGTALRLLHDDPARPWTVATLAGESGASRASLARRFTAQVGEPPMTYLAGWRIALAADLLAETDATVGSIARKVGYANTFALSVAFKRVLGTTPTEHRATAAARAPVR
ncbi:AraC family transcriptional regulator [Allokutzneria oryzae]|uniref:AraC family transcriptional regulator n=1 Tax=Allokutzneria oryzae TaxID=1378989 RepID=A0ABV6A6V4_9PSEU